MGKYWFNLLIALIVFSCNCQDQSMADFLNSREGRKITLFEEANNTYFPSSMSFDALRPMNNEGKVDVLDKISFSQFLIRFVKENNISYRQFILIESYESGEKISKRKVLIFDCRGKQGVISFDNVLGNWIAKSTTSESKYLFDQLEQIFSLAPDNQDRGIFVVASYVKCAKVQKIGLVSATGREILKQYFL